MRNFEFTSENCKNSTKRTGKVTLVGNWREKCEIVGNLTGEIVGNCFSLAKVVGAVGTLDLLRHGDRMNRFRAIWLCDRDCWVDPSIFGGDG